MAAVKEEMNQRDRKLLERLVKERTEELERANERLLLANQVKGEFLAHMSKELRTPLNYIIDFATLILDGTMGGISPEQRACLDSIVESSSRLRAIVDRILELCAIDIGMTRFLPKRFPVAETTTSRIMVSASTIFPFPCSSALPCWRRYPVSGPSAGTS